MKQKIFITLDMDWACDGVLEDAYSLMDELDICATMNITHETKWNSIYRSDPRFELGIHPNFNNLLIGKAEGSFKDIIKNMMKLVPEAVTVRSHALTGSSIILNEFIKNGLLFDLNTYIPPNKGTALLPFYRYQTIKMIPFIYEDDLFLAENLKWSIDYLLNGEFKMYKVFNFHPIHLFLNSENLQRYEECKKYYHNYQSLKKFQNVKEYGIRNFFIDLVAETKKYGYEFCQIREIEGGGYVYRRYKFITLPTKVLNILYSK